MLAHNLLPLVAGDSFGHGVERRYVTSSVHRENPNVQVIQDEFEPMLVIVNPVQQFAISRRILKDFDTSGYLAIATQDRRDQLGDAAATSAFVLDLNIKRQRLATCLDRLAVHALAMTQVAEKHFIAFLTYDLIFLETG
jgi:hypothetical protein